MKINCKSNNRKNEALLLVKKIFSLWWNQLHLSKNDPFYCMNILLFKFILSHSRYLSLSTETPTLLYFINQVRWSQMSQGAMPPLIWINVLKRSVLFEINWKVFRISSFWIRRSHEDTTKSKSLRSLLNKITKVFLENIQTNSKTLN